MSAVCGLGCADRRGWIVNRRLLRMILMMFTGATAARRPGPLLALFRWRYEIAALAAVFGAGRLGAIAASVIGLVVIVAVIAWSELRAWLLRRVWVVVIRHRLRSAFRGAALASWTGRRPAILWTSPRPKGVRVVLSLPAGLELADIVALRHVLSAACFAADVLIDRHPRYGNVVVLFCIPREPW
jgi:hypothetical protein